MFKDKDIVLFQGDSITDAGRNRDEFDHMGYGYPMMASSLFIAEYPEKDVTFINKGIGGDRTIDLMKRWDEDCLKLNPTFVSIYIGINDCWRKYDNNEETSADVFEENYRYLLNSIKNNLKAELMLVEPFVLPYPEDRKAWREDLDPKIEIVRKLSKEYNTLLLPLDDIFRKALKYKASSFWANDGVHPSNAGHALIAKEWLKLVK